MATNFPSYFDSFVNPISGEPLNSPNQATLVSNLNDAVIALETKIGVDSSSDVSSLDYKINNLNVHAITYIGGTGISVSAPVSHVSTVTNTGVVGITGTSPVVVSGDPHHPVISIPGGISGGTWPNYSGSGTPNGTITPAAKGNTYVDTTNGAQYISIGTTNTSWSAVGGQFDYSIESGVSVYSGIVGISAGVGAGAGSSSGIDIENNGPGGISINDNGGGGINLTGTASTSAINLLTYGGGITITELGNGGINLISNPSGGSGYYIYTGTNYAGLPITANINTPAWGYTVDGNIYFNNGAGWVAWTGLNSKEVLAQASPGATPTLNTDAYGVFHFTVVSTDITSMTTNLSGTPVDGDSIRISFTDNGTARAITWGLGFEDASSTLPHSTIATIRLDVGFIWDSETNKWRCVASTIPNFATGLTTASAPGAVNSDGTSVSPARADHKHAREAAVVIPSRAGEIVMFGGASAPTNSFFCDGSAVSRTSHAALFAAIGTTWGTGDGSTTFNLPNFRGVSPIGVGTGTHTGTTPRTLAAFYGAETVTLTQSQLPTAIGTAAAQAATTSVSVPGTSFVIGLYNTAQNNSIGGPVGAGNGNGVTFTDHATSVTTTNSQSDVTNSGGGNASPNLGPVLGVNFIIYSQ